MIVLIVGVTALLLTFYFGRMLKRHMDRIDRQNRHVENLKRRYNKLEDIDYENIEVDLDEEIEIQTDKLNKRKNGE